MASRRTLATLLWQRDSLALVWPRRLDLFDLRDSSRCRRDMRRWYRLSAFGFSTISPVERAARWCTPRSTPTTASGFLQVDPGGQFHVSIIHCGYDTLPRLGQLRSFLGAVGRPWEVIESFVRKNQGDSQPRSLVVMSNLESQLYLLAYSSITDTTSDYYHRNLKRTRGNRVVYI